MRTWGGRFGLVALTLGLILGGCWALSWGRGEKQWGSFRGEIVDSETAQPIKGAAVLVVWSMVIPTPVHDVQKFYDAREAVTDAAGRFEVPGVLPPLYWLLVRRPQVIFFAPGYMLHAEGVTPPDGRPFVDPTVVQMRRLKTREELLKKSRSRPGGVPLEKMKEFTRAINVESRMLGLGELSIEPTPGGRP